MIHKKNDSQEMVLTTWVAPLAGILIRPFETCFQKETWSEVSIGPFNLNLEWLSQLSETKKVLRSIKNVFVLHCQANKSQYKQSR